jgi:hypothetical protein
MSPTEASILSALHPSTRAVLELVRSVSASTREEICFADSGWGEHETREFLHLLATEDRFDGPLDSQVWENLELTTWHGRGSSVDRDADIEPDSLAARALACAILLRASGDPKNQRLEFFGLESPVVQLISSALVCSVPSPESTVELFAWRLAQPRPINPSIRTSLWLGILILMVQTRTAHELAIAAQVAQVAHESIVLARDEAFWVDEQFLRDRWHFWINRSVARSRHLGVPRLAALLAEIRRLVGRVT